MINKIDLDALFCYVDDFCIGFEPAWYKKLIGKASPIAEEMTLAEVLTILIWFQTSGWRCFKNFYLYLNSIIEKISQNF